MLFLWLSDCWDFLIAWIAGIAWNTSFMNAGIEWSSNESSHESALNEGIIIPHSHIQGYRHCNPRNAQRTDSVMACLVECQDGVKTRYTFLLPESLAHGNAYVLPRSVKNCMVLMVCNTMPMEELHSTLPSSQQSRELLVFDTGPHSSLLQTSRSLGISVVWNSLIWHTGPTQKLAGKLIWPADSDGRRIYLIPKLTEFSGCNREQIDVPREPKQYYELPLYSPLWVLSRHCPLSNASLGWLELRITLGAGYDPGSGFWPCLSFLLQPHPRSKRKSGKFYERWRANRGQA